MSRHTKLPMIERFPTDLAGLTQVIGRVYASLAGIINLFGDGLVMEVTEKSVDYTASVGDWVIEVDATGGNKAITLPNASETMGKRYVIKKVDGTSHAVTVSAAVGNIDGAATYDISTAYGSAALFSDGTGYWIETSPSDQYQIDGGLPSSVYGGTHAINGGVA